MANLTAAILIQRVENLAIAVAVAVAVVVWGEPWWWLVVLFLLFDLSMIGYLGGPRLGALAYNVVHSYTMPALLAVVGFMLDASWWWIAVAAWTFHVGLDRALGYGLKTDEGFAHTHLGVIGPANRRPTA